MQIGTRLTSSYRKNRESNFLVDAKGSILLMETSFRDTGKYDSIVPQENKNIPVKDFTKPTSNSDKRITNQDDHLTNEEYKPTNYRSDHLQKVWSYLETIDQGQFEKEKGKKKYEEFVREAQDKGIIRQDDDLAELTTKFLETNTVYTSVSASLARFENHSNSQQGNPDQNSDIRKYLDDLQKIQSHLETIKSENLELEGFEEYEGIS